MNHISRAKVLLIELDSLKQASNETTTVFNTLTLLNEVLKDAERLAKEVIASDSDERRIA